MKIFVTGSTGFIGSHFVKQALSTGHSVLALRRTAASTPRISWEQDPQWLNHPMEEVSADNLNGCDVLVHLAAHTGNVPYDNLKNCLKWNLMAVLALFEQARLAGIQHFVVAGSCFEYGRSGERYVAIPTTAPLEPTNSYAASKAAASIALNQWAEESQVSFSILRVFHVYGEGESETRLWPSLRRAALAGLDFPMTSGEQIRDFIPVEQVAKIFLDQVTWLHEQPKGTVVVKNIGSGMPQSIRHFCEYWWDHWQGTGKLLVGVLPYRDCEVMRYVPEI